MNKNRVLVTGSSGFVGSHLVRKLIEMNYEPLCIDHSLNINLTDFDRVKHFSDFDTLIHLAGRTFVPFSYENPREFYHNNMLATLNALELCKINNARMVFASSYVYGNPKYLPIDEQHSVSAFNPYAHSKLIGEQLCEGYHRDFGVPVIVLRPFNIYGYGQRNDFLIPSIFHQASSNSIQLKDPSPKRDFLYIDDMVQAYIKCIELEDLTFEVFNIGSGESYSVEEIAYIIADKYPGKIPVNFTGEVRKNEVRDTKADISKAKSKLGWAPRIDFRQGIELMSAMY